LNIYELIYQQRLYKDNKLPYNDRRGQSMEPKRSRASDTIPGSYNLTNNNLRTMEKNYPNLNNSINNKKIIECDYCGSKNDYYALRCCLCSKPIKYLENKNTNSNSNANDYSNRNRSQIDNNLRSSVNSSTATTGYVNNINNNFNNIGIGTGMSQSTNLNKNNNTNMWICEFCKKINKISIFYCQHCKKNDSSRKNNYNYGSNNSAYSSTYNSNNNSKFNSFLNSSKPTNMKPVIPNDPILRRNIATPNVQKNNMTVSFTKPNNNGSNLSNNNNNSINNSLNSSSIKNDGRRHSNVISTPVVNKSKFR
jgi:hypothetical protein